MINNKPNILFIMYDQQRYDCVSMSDMYPVKTPNLERIADKGVFFEKAYTPIPVCTPARQALFTGKRPEAYGGLWNPHIVFPIRSTPSDGYLWTRAIKDNGYNTAYVGLWEADSAKQPTDYGFDTYIGRGDINKIISDKYPGVIYNNGYFGESNPVPLEDSYTHLTAEFACERIEELSKQDKPWYIHIDSPEPHLPCRPSAPFDTMYNPDDIPMWGSFGETFDGKPYIQHQQLINWELEDRGWDEWKHTVACYYGIVSQYDDAVGRILDKLEETGEIENTIIIYTTDHGDLGGGHRLIDKHCNMYEDICHVPLAIRWDNHIQPNRYTGHIHNCLDIQPTLLSLIGLETPDDFQGIDISNCLLNGIESDGRIHAVSTYNGQQFGLYCARMICNSEYKYVWNLTDIDEFYDLRNDPNELTNIIYDESIKDIVTDMRVKLHEELTKCNDPILRWNSNQLLKNRKL